MNTPRLILASSSRYRRELLDRLQLTYEAISPTVDETPLEGETPLQIAVRLAKAKAEAIAKINHGAVVIGSDQVCEFEGKAIGKPHTFERALLQMTAMQGKEAVFHTALCVIDANGNAYECVSDTHVKLRPLTKEAITNYLKREEPYDCAGSAKIERLGIALMESVTSDDPTSLIGLPLMKLTTLLKQAGITPIEGL